MKGKFKTPYYAVIFSSKRTLTEEGYAETATEMVELAEKQSGYLGIESYREGNGKGVTISYWKSMEDIKVWKSNLAHAKAQKSGKEKWYENYTVRICKVEKEYSFEAE